MRTRRRAGSGRCLACCPRMRAISFIRIYKYEFRIFNLWVPGARWAHIPRLGTQHVRHHPSPRPRADQIGARHRAGVQRPRSRELLERIERLAPSEANALVIGETGTGKELVARHIHALSGRSGGRSSRSTAVPSPRAWWRASCSATRRAPLPVRCRARPAGSRRPTAAPCSSTRSATCRRASRSLLRVLQEREVVRLGSRRPIPIDVRLVAATNVDLADAVVAGHFREDLFYRLHVATIQLPPLRERRGDILPLAEYFIVEHCRRLGYTSASLSPEAERKLLGHSWAGNIRELENAIHHALLVCRNRLIQPADLHLIDMRARQEPSGLRRAPGAPPARRWKRRCRHCSRKTARISTSTSRKPCSAPPIASATATSCRPDACWGSAATSCAPAWRRSASWKPRHDTTWSRWWASERGALQSFTIPHKTGKNPDGGCSTTER